jgi:uncharacterized protein YbjT (DUF2867 family)
MIAPLITVFGATGRQGGGLVRAMLADPHRRFRVRAVTRRPRSDAARALAAAGADVCAADLDVAASVERAMRGAHGAFCTTSSREHGSPERELAHAHGLARAAARAGVAHVVWATFEDTREFVRCGAMPARCGRYNVPSQDAKGEANRAFVDSGVPTTLLYPSFAWDDLLRIGVARRPDGTLELLLPFDATTLPGMAAEDVGTCALALFVLGEDAIGKSVGLAGEHLAGARMAELLAAALGTPVVHAPPRPDMFAARDLPGAAELANLFCFKRDCERIYRNARSVRCTRELHPQALTFTGWLAKHRAALRDLVGDGAR